MNPYRALALTNVCRIRIASSSGRALILHVEIAQYLNINNVYLFMQITVIIYRNNKGVVIKDKKSGTTIG